MRAIEAFIGSKSNHREPIAPVMQRKRYIYLYSIVSRISFPRFFHTVYVYDNLFERSTLRRQSRRMDAPGGRPYAVPGAQRYDCARRLSPLLEVTRAS